MHESTNNKQTRWHCYNKVQLLYLRAARVKVCFTPFQYLQEQTRMNQKFALCTEIAEFTLFRLGFGIFGCNSVFHRRASCVNLQKPDVEKDGGSIQAQSFDHVRSL